MLRRRQKGEKALQKLRTRWLERCEEIAETFLEGARRKRTSLHHLPADLEALERFLLRRRATLTVRFSRKTRRRLVLGASAYLAQVIIRNIGGKLGWETSLDTVSVDDVGGQGIKAFPWDRVAELVDEGWGEPLKEYYERIEEAVEARGQGDWQLNEDDVWGQIQRRVQALRDEGRDILKNTGKLDAKLLPLTYCPACHKLGDGENGPLRPQPDQLRRGFRLFVLSALSDARWERCSDCRGQLLPLGYSFSTLGWYLLRRSEGGLNSTPSKKLPKREEVYVTALNTTLRQSLFLRSLVHRVKEKVTEIEEDEQEDLKGGQFLVALPSTPFYF